MTQYVGGCMCGKIRYRISGKPVFSHFCSCDDCQRWSGAPAVAWVDFPLSSVVWDGLNGEPTKVKSGERTLRGFCPTCGSSLYATDDDPKAKSISITISTFDDPNLIVPGKSHSFREMAPKWLIVKAEAPKRSKSSRKGAKGNLHTYVAKRRGCDSIQHDECNS